MDICMHLCAYVYEYALCLSMNLYLRHYTSVYAREWTFYEQFFFRYGLLECNFT